MFVVEVPPGGTALIKGPAEAQCKEACPVFGGRFTYFQVPPHKQYPVEGPATIYIRGGAVELVPQSTIPEDWRLELSGVVALVGPTDSGKSSLSTYILNTHVTRGMRVCVVDADVGQSDIGPPGFVAYSCTSAPTPHISELPPEDAYFVGSVNLQGVEELLVAGVVRCVREALRQYPHLVVINTPGWTAGRGAQLLRALVEAVDASVVNIGEAVLPGIVATRPRQVAPRSPQERRELRVYAYRRHIKLQHKVVVDAGRITNCQLDKALNCPWGKYAVGDVAEPERKGREYVVPAAYLRHLLAALYKNKKLVGYGIVEKINQKAYLYATTEDFDEVKLGKIRLDPHTLEELEPLP